MTTHLLNRDDAPIAGKTWEAVDGAVLGAARSQLSARRLLYVEGPFGLGLKSVPLKDRPVEGDEVDERVTLSAGANLALTAVQSAFRLNARDIAAFEQSNVPLDLGEAAAAGIAVARQEDALLFNGARSLHIEGLMNAKGVQSSDLRSWNSVGTAAENVISAATKLDAAGFHGPYALALAPALYNQLFRLNPDGHLTELDHLRQIATDGVVKAPGIAAGGVLLATGRQFAGIVLGQDIMVGFVGPVGRDYEFTVSESLALRILEAGAVCVLKAASRG